ncbi:MAG: aminoacetone oxidase family FAD-binding enzyme [Planctomycetes bacterium]|nr:aminoacetone oxidase family FAD-binding enzyme [Planctomycetota bacterium]
MTAIHAGRGGLRGVVALDGARTLGAKILVAGGGRCNVTHQAVDERDYAGSTPASIRRVLARFSVEDCVAFFEALGVALKVEDTGKLFPVSDRARTVLEALLGAAASAGVSIRHPCRVETIEPMPQGGFMLGGAWGRLHAARLALCTGGCSLPRSGSDGAGLAMARSLGHTVTERVVPSLVPLLLAEGFWLRQLSGVAVPAELRVLGPGGKRLVRFRNAVLFTHFGLSGPAALDISRHWTLHHALDAEVRLQLALLPDMDEAACSRWLLEGTGRGVLARLREHLPERLARAVLEASGVEMEATPQRIDRDRRRELVRHLVGLDLPVTGDRGFTHAETTAGGVPLREVHLETMESRIRPGLHLAGEILDVDGRIGGFNFQWAWASGFIAGSAVAEAECRA